MFSFVSPKSSYTSLALPDFPKVSSIPILSNFKSKFMKLMALN